MTETKHLIHDDGTLYLYDNDNVKNEQGKWVSNYEVVGKGFSYKVQVIEDNMFKHINRKLLLENEGKLFLPDMNTYSDLYKRNTEGVSAND